jgi:hypothetical protein
MAIVLFCEKCGKRYDLDLALAGKRVRCKQCEFVMRVQDEAPPHVVRQATFDEDDEGPLPTRHSARSRRSPQGGKLPFLVKAGLGLIGTLVLLATLGVSALMVAAGHPEHVGMPLALLAFFASAGLASVSFLKLVFMAEEASPMGGTAAFLNPFYLLTFITQNWKHTRRLTYLHLAGLAGLVLCIVFVPPYLEAHKGLGSGGMHAGPNRGAFVNLIVTGTSSDEARALIGEALKDLVDPGGSSGFEARSSGDQTEYTLWPVRDPAAFSNRITFGKVTRVNGRRIEVTAGADAIANLAREEEDRRADVSNLKTASTPATATADRPTELPPPADADPLTRELFALNAHDNGKKKEAVQRLARMIPADNRRDEVQAALRPFLEHEDGFLVDEVINAMAAWRTEETVPALISKTTDSRFGVRWHAIETLGKLGDPRAAAAIADRLKEDGIKSEPALRALGPAAEPTLIPLLHNSDPDIRRKTCEILRDIGGTDTLIFM